MDLTTYWLKKGWKFALFPQCKDETHQCPLPKGHLLIPEVLIAIVILFVYITIHFKKLHCNHTDKWEKKSCVKPKGTSVKEEVEEKI